jgi:hypothetical protein
MDFDKETYSVATPRDVRSLEDAIHGSLGFCRWCWHCPRTPRSGLGFGRLQELKVPWSQHHRMSATWTVSTRGTRVLVNGRTAAVGRLKALVGCRVDDLNVTYPQLSLVLALDCGESIEVRPSRSDARSAVAYWFVRMPRRTEIAAGPGSRWHRTRLPRFISDQWRARVTPARKQALLQKKSAASRAKEGRIEHEPSAARGCSRRILGYAEGGEARAGCGRARRRHLTTRGGSVPTCTPTRNIHHRGCATSAGRCPEMTAEQYGSMPSGTAQCPRSPWMRQFSRT